MKSDMNEEIIISSDDETMDATNDDNETNAKK